MKVSALRKIVKDMQTKSVKCSRTGNSKGGVILTDETVKPYMEELSKLEAKMAKEKEQAAKISKISMQSKAKAKQRQRREAASDTDAAIKGQLEAAPVPCREM